MRRWHNPFQNGLKMRPNEHVEIGYKWSPSIGSEWTLKSNPIDTKPFIEYLRGHLDHALKVAEDETRPRASRIVYAKEAELLRQMIAYIGGSDGCNG